MSRACSSHAYNILVVEGKRPLRKSKHKWENIKKDLEKVGCEGADYIQLVLVRGNGGL
jgi:hypothetical protein